MSTKELATKKKKPKAIENFFNLPMSEKRLAEQEPAPPAKTVQAPEYDEKDDEVEELYENIHDAAMQTHERILDDIEDMEPKYAARNYEVAANFLNIALSAADKKGKLKEHKDKLQTKSQPAAPTIGSITNQSVTINTTDLIKQLAAESKVQVPVIEGEVVSETKEPKPNE
jgi:hypothetical protein